MMKLSANICVFNLLLISGQVYSLSDPLSMSSYEKVMVCKGYDQVAIYNEVVHYFRDQGIAVFSHGSMDQVGAKGEFKIYNNIISVIKNPIGEVAFDIRIDIKDEKFRMTLFNLWFRPFERDRYGKLVLSSEDPELVSTEDFKHRRSLLKKIEKQVQAYVDKTVKVISEKMINKEFEITDW